MFTYDEFMAAMEAAVEDRGADWVYPRASEAAAMNGNAEDDWHFAYGECKYSLPDGSPACIIGEVLFRLDPTMLPGPDVLDSASGVLEWERFEDFERVAKAADAAQLAQDSGAPWGEALAQAKWSGARLTQQA